MAQPQTFSAAIDKWIDKTEKRVTNVLREAALLVDHTVSLPVAGGGNLPVVTGNLRRSRAASTIGPPAILWKEKTFSGSDEAIASVIKGAAVGQTVWIGFQAPYAGKAEDKHGFVRLTAQRWPQLVEQAARSLKDTT